MVRDAFPLPQIDEAPQAVHSSKWFTSINLTQVYLQLAMKEGNIQKTAFRARSSGLYEFTNSLLDYQMQGLAFVI